MNYLKKYRYLIARRFIQLALLVLFFGANIFGWRILAGNYSAALVFDRIPLTDPFALLQMLFSGAVITADILIGGAFVSAFYAIIGGRIFCSWVCPVNIVTDTAFRIKRKLKTKNELKISRNMRYGILGLGLALSFIHGVSAFELISPVGLFHRGLIFGFGGGLFVIIALFLFDISVRQAGWCGHLCPIGAMYALIGKYSIIKVKHDASACTDCGKCFPVCHERQVLDIIGKKDGFIMSSECTNCARCVEACEDMALAFSYRNSLVKNKV